MILLYTVNVATISGLFRSCISNVTKLLKCTILMYLGTGQCDLLRFIQANKPMGIRLF